MAYCSHQATNSCHLKNCENHGTLSTAESGSAVGGVAGLIKCYNLIGCRNYGNVINPTETRGLLIGSVQTGTNPSVVTDCALKGSIGVSASSMTAATASNYLELGITIASDATLPTWNSDNVHFLE